MLEGSQRKAYRCPKGTTVYMMSYQYLNLFLLVGAKVVNRFSHHCSVQPSPGGTLACLCKSKAFPASSSNPMQQFDLAKWEKHASSLFRVTGSGITALQFSLIRVWVAVNCQKIYICLELWKWTDAVKQKNKTYLHQVNTVTVYASQISSQLTLTS